MTALRSRNRWRAVLVTILSAFTVIVGLIATPMAAMKAAGVEVGTPIPGLDTFISTLKGNVVWLVLTLAVVAALVIGGLHMAGHSRAHDFLIRFLIGAAIVVALGTAIVS